MKAVLVDSNRAKGLFIYAVLGSEEEIERYVASKGDNVRFFEEGKYAGKPKYFTKFPIGKEVTLKFSSEGNVFVDNTDIDLKVAVTNGFGDTPIGRALATEVAKDILSNIGRKTAVTEPQPEPQEDPIDKG